MAVVLSLLKGILLAVSCHASLPPLPNATGWSSYRHEALGVEIQYPANWQVDSTSAFVRFCDAPQAPECFDVVSASFGFKQPTDFLAHPEPPVARTQPLTLDGQDALLLELQPVPQAQGIKAAVSLITPYGRDLTIGNRTSSEVFDRTLASVKFFGPTSKLFLARAISIQVS